MNPSLTVCHINNHCLLLIKGPDARKFLQGQVTCDIDQLKITNTNNNQQLNSSLGAHCTHKGRVVFSFRALAIDEQTIALQIPNDIVETATAALQKYIVFSKADIINASEEYRLYGVHGDDAISTLQTLLPANSIPTESNTATQSSDGIALCLGDQRYELWLNTKQASQLEQAVTDITLEDCRYWDLLNINAGIAEIRQATSGLFTPHAINFHTTGNAVSFQKGCYTGQEVVARMHYLGKLKRQLFLVEIPTNTLNNTTPVNIGDPVYSQGKDQSIGDIVLMAATDTSTRLLISAAVDSATNNNVFLGSKGQHQLSVLDIA